MKLIKTAKIPHQKPILFNKKENKNKKNNKKIPKKVNEIKKDNQLRSIFCGQ